MRVRGDAGISNQIKLFVAETFEGVASLANLLYDKET